jgi:hypothetical protein
MEWTAVARFPLGLVWMARDLQINDQKAFLLAGWPQV